MQWKYFHVDIITLLVYTNSVKKGRAWALKVKIMAKKVDVKAMAKAEVKKQISALFANCEIIDMAETPFEGFTKDTLIIRSFGENKIDVQVKLITPSAKTGNHYLLDSED